jgi:hypothetical protein
LVKAICIRCGQYKAAPSRTCGRCHLDPSSDDELLVRSAYFSVERFEKPSDREAYCRELEKIAESLKAGEPGTADERELERLRAQLRLVREVGWRNVLGALARIFLPAMVVLAALYGAIFVLQSWRD